ncbi:protein MTSS 1 isoform X2 [Callorhinchus milii]|uniref:protein MTSS 1 isoform X2 n=1 Tax=Callorhinchus milii TaxID=7868 RepID=UPI0004574B28|nr:protein MTSS 1 isoform X2 [Callorhinchus milii]|eukprot:gi/632981262/ref/XP_007907493.1/ PREDICTED: MTSS1-like protein [Callorhinchus milii]
MDVGMEKDCSALGGLFQTIMTDLKSGYPVWEDFISKASKLQSHLRTTIVVAGAFLDAFQKVADLATNTRGATKDIGSALTRVCMRHRSVESRLKQFTVALTDSLINPLEMRIEEWKKVANQLDKDHTKEYKKARQEIKKKSSDTLKLQKKAKKGKEDVRLQLDCAMQDVNDKYMLLEDTEKQAVCRGLIEERARFCAFVSMLRPVLDEEIGMLGEITHLQTILEDLGNLTAEPQKLPPASEQVILDLKISDDYNYTYHTPPSSPGSTLSRSGTINSSQYLHKGGRHTSIASLNSVFASTETLHVRTPSVLVPDGGSQDWGKLKVGESGLAGNPPHMDGARHRRNGENGPPTPTDPHGARTQRSGSSSAPGKAGDVTAREQLALALGQGFTLDVQRSSRDSLHCSSGYSTQTTTPSCSEDTIPSQATKRDQSLVVPDYDSVSLHGDQELPHSLLMEFDRSSTIPRNSDLSHNLRRLLQERRPTSTVSLLEPEPPGAPHVATIRRKPTFRRGTLSGMPIPIRTPVVPAPSPPEAQAQACPRPATSCTGSKECMSQQAPRPGLAYRKPGLCGSTHSLGLGLSAGLEPGPGVHGQPFGTLQRSAPDLQESGTRSAAAAPAGNGLGLGPHPPHPGPGRTEAAVAVREPEVLSQAQAQASPPPPASPGPGDMLSMIRRGVSLRKTSSNDRSAPQLW